MLNYNLKNPIYIAGPCSAESREQIYLTAMKLIGNISFFRAGIWKPRTRPNNFEGVGEKGISWLKSVKNDFNLPIATEVLNTRHVDICLKNSFDAVWLGARTTVNPFLVDEIAQALKGTDIVVMVKNRKRQLRPIF